MIAQPALLVFIFWKDNVSLKKDILPLTLIIVKRRLATKVSLVITPVKNVQELLITNAPFATVDPTCKITNVC